MGRVEFSGFKCERCGHLWAPRQALDSGEPVTLPKVCPSCKSAWWDVPKKGKAKPARKERKTEKAGPVGGA
ncbi:MAG TPA: hypothetical protein VGG32_07680 [Thermoplasmata archaeon]|jgi:uncharacterized OB-fold protein